METRLLYLDDSYAKEFTATILDAFKDEKSVDPPDRIIYIVLDQTLFYPNGGGQPSDTGIIEFEGAQIAVLEVVKRDGRILHKIDIGTSVAPDNISSMKGKIILGRIDWDRRYMLMRMHTSAHLINAVLYRDAGILVTGNSLGIDKSRIDFNMPDFSLEKVQEYIHEANLIISKDLEVKTYYLPREEAFKIPGIVKLKDALPPDIPILRITEIIGLDIQADGGTHVHHLKEIGKINISGIENKGKERKRICYTLAT